MDGISMDSDGTTRAMRQMDDVGRTLDTGWGEAGRQLDALSGQLGRGELGAAYRDRYETAAADTAAAVTRLCRMPVDLATAGDDCVAIYLAADRAGAAGLTRGDAAG